MGWLWVVLAVLVLGAVALLAAGRGSVGTPAPSHRPDLALPPDRPLTAGDVDAVRFSVGLRGYRMDEVDAVLARMSEELAARDRELADLRPLADPGPAAERERQLARLAAQPEPPQPEPADPGAERVLVVSLDDVEPVTPTEGPDPEQPHGE